MYPDQVVHLELQTILTRFYYSYLQLCLWEGFFLLCLMLDLLTDAS